MEILFIDNMKTDISLKVTEMYNREIKEVIQYEYSDSIESIKTKLEVYKINNMFDCRVGTNYARLRTYTDDDFIIRIDKGLLEELKPLNVYHIVKL